jgi:hypothetical protein
MAKRPPIQLEELTDNLKASTGRGVNAFFSQPSPQPTTPEKGTESRQQQRPAPPVRPVPVVPPVPGKRIMRRRYPLDIYEDQYQSLLEYQRAERKEGRLGSMSEFVRIALDVAIEKYKRKGGK